MRADDLGAGTVTTGAVDHAAFRAMFLGAVRDKYGDDYFQKAKDFLVFAPTPELLSEPSAASSDAFLAAARDKTRTFTPLDLYQVGVAAGTQPLPTSTLDAALAKLRDRAGEPLTIVVVPGIFGEFIDARAFEEVYAPHADGSPTAFQTQWQAANPQAQTDDSAGTAMTLDKLVTVGSMDDAQGQALVDVMVFETPRLSLESVSLIEMPSAAFARRLGKAFTALGHVPKNLAFIGYSRGAMIALDMLAKASAANTADATAAAWLPNVKAMITLGGVVYGTTLADSLADPQATTSQEVAAVEELSQDLDAAAGWATASDWQKTKIATKNLGVWAHFIKRLAVLNAPTLKGSSLDQITKNAESITSNLARVDANPSLQMLSLVWNEFHLSSPFGAAYPGNIAHFKVVVKAMLDGVRELASAPRLQWWQTHTVPTAGLRYYSLTSTMSEQAPLKANPYVGIPGGPDDASLQSSYDGYVTQSQVNGGPGLTLNDSQVSYEVARFWPSLAPLLNPKQAPMDFTYLGLLGSSHWGLTLPIVTKLKSGQLNPFPRYELLRAIAAAVATDLSAKDNGG